MKPCVPAGSGRSTAIVLFSSHQMNYVEEFCESIAILNQGRIVLSGKIKEIKRGYDRRKLVITSENVPALKSAADGILSPYIEASIADTGRLLITLSDESKKAEFTVKMAELGIDFDGITVYEPSLNDIFVEYTED